MTTDGLLGERPNDVQSQVPLEQILDLCDGIVGEVGRRGHMFGWLRAADGERFLTVDSYYPAHRLVVLCREPADDDGSYAERVPARGMRLLSLSPAELGPDRESASAALSRRVAQLGPAPPRAHPAPTEPVGSVVARAVASLAAPPVAGPRPVTREPTPRRSGQTQAEAAQRAARFIAAHQTKLPPAVAERERAGARVASARASEVLQRVLGPPEERRASVRAPIRRQALGAGLGAVLVLALVAEVYFGVGVLAIGGGHVLLALGLSLDVGARALGTLAAGRAGDQPSARWCAIGGSPLVARFALLAPSGPANVEPAPLAGVVAVSACALVALWLLGAVLGI
jgi:hypothetical protein